MGEMTEKCEYCSTVPRTLSRIVAMGNVEVAYRAFSSKWPASMQIYWNERKRWH